MDLALSVESALVDDLIWWMSVDWSECFDRVAQGVAFKLLERQGIHPRVSQPVRGMYRELQPLRGTLELDGSMILQQVRLHPRNGSSTMI